MKEWSDRKRETERERRSKAEREKEILLFKMLYLVSRATDSETTKNNKCVRVYESVVLG